MRTLNSETAFQIPEWFTEMSRSAQKEYLKKHTNSRLAKFLKKEKENKKEKPIKENPFKAEDKQKKEKPEKEPETKAITPTGKSAVDILKKDGSPTDFKGPKSNNDGISDDYKAERKVVSLLGRLAKLASDAKKKGKAAPNYDLCQVSIEGTNLFCQSHKDIKRQDMPQLKGVPVPGSWGDSNLKKSEKGEVDGEKEFVKHLKEKGVKMKKKKVDASELKATQKELVGVKVAGMLEALKSDPENKGITAPIFVSKDGYVLDGHHRWAAMVGLSLADGIPNPVLMNIVEVDMKIDELVEETNDFAEKIGIAQKKAQAKLFVLAEFKDCGCGGTCMESKRVKILASDDNADADSPQYLNFHKKVSKDEDEHLLFIRVKDSLENIFREKVKNFDMLYGGSDDDHIQNNPQGFPQRFCSTIRYLVGRPRKERFDTKIFIEKAFDNDFRDELEGLGFNIESFGKADSFIDDKDMMKVRCIETGLYFEKENDYACFSAVGYNSENIRVEFYVSIRPSVRKQNGYALKVMFCLDFTDQYV